MVPVGVAVDVGVTVSVTDGATVGVAVTVAGKVPVGVGVLVAVSVALGVGGAVLVGVGNSTSPTGNAALKAEALVVPSMAIAVTCVAIQLLLLVKVKRPSLPVVI